MMTFLGFALLESAEETSTTKKRKEKTKTSNPSDWVH